MEKMVSKLVVKMTLLMLMFQLAKAAAPVAKFGCPDRCGDITIPYPFGTGKDCYKDEWFAVECNKTTNPPRAFISRIKMEVMNISAETGLATVKSPVISFNCTGRKDGGSLDLTGSPFVFSDSWNVFIAGGCDTRAFMSGIEPQVLGCVPTCGNQRSNVSLQENNMCSGRNCCQASIPSLLQVFKPRLDPTNVDQGREACKLAVLVNRTWFASNISDPFALQYKDYVPAILGWVMNVNYSDDISFYCQRNNSESLKSECACWPGFEGNPYLELGCKGKYWSNFFLDLFIIFIQAIVFFVCVYVIKFNDGKCQIKIKC